MPEAEEVEPRFVSPQMRFEYGQGRFVSVQVNVDAQGNNIGGDAANEPTIAMVCGNPGRLVIGWRQFDTINSNFREAGRAYSTDGGRTWTFPGVLTNGTFRSDPVLAADTNGTVFYYSLKSNFLCDMFRSFDGGQTFEAPIAAYGGDKAWMTIDQTDSQGNNHIYISWSTVAGCCGNRIFTRSTDGGATYLNPITLPNSPVWGTLDVASNGDLYVVGSNTVSTFSVVRSANAKDSSVIPTFSLRNGNVNMGGSVVFGGPNPDGLTGQLWVAVDKSSGPRNGYVYMLSTVDPPGGDPANVNFVRSTDGGVTWSAPVKVNDDGGTNAWQWFGTLSIAPSGRLDAIWNDTRNGENMYMSQVFYAYSTDGGVTWSPNEAATGLWDSRVGWPRQNKIGDYYHMISDDAGAMLAYAATFNGEQDVYFMRITIDCNGNGIHDGDDIANGTSPDVNGDWLPDECQGPNCNLIREYAVTCRTGRLVAKVKSALPTGTVLTFDNDGDRRTGVVDDRGKARAKWKNQYGNPTVYIVECPQFSRTANCN